MKGVEMALHKVDNSVERRKYIVRISLAGYVIVESYARDDAEALVLAENNYENQKHSACTIPILEIDRSQEAEIMARQNGERFVYLIDCPNCGTVEKEPPGGEL